MLNFDFLEKINASLDMATEAHNLLRGTENIEIPGVSEKITNQHGIKITSISIFNAEGATSMKREQGEYITIDAPNLMGDGETDTEETISSLRENCALVLAKALKPLLPTDDKPVLICGLGNPQITADALGPMVIEKSMATRHLFLYMAEHMEEGFGDVALFTPNVMGNTGIEALESIKSLSSEIQAKAVIVIDALAASSVSRVGNSLQIANTGITPGAGLGNVRQGINEETLGIPVIAIGVPTVVLLSAVMGEAIFTTKENLIATGNKKAAEILDETSAVEIIRKLLANRHEQFAVTPKDIDEVTNNLSQILTLGLHLALHSTLNLKNYHQYLNIRL